MPPGLVLTLLSVLFQLACLWWAGAELSPLLGISVLAISAVATRTGVLVLGAWGNRLVAWWPAVLVTGFGVLSVAMMAAAILLRISPVAAFALASVLVLPASWYVQSKPVPLCRIDLGVGVAHGLVTLLLGASAIGSAATLIRFGHLPAWSDAYLHAITIAGFGSPRALGGDILLSGADRVFYHYAPFMVPAALQQLSDLHALTLATGYLLPLGLWFAGFGLYVFGAEIGGRSAGMAILAALIVVPMPALYVLQAGWFKFAWLLFASPGSGYAIGLACVVAALAAGALQPLRWQPLVLGGVLLFGLIFVRAHIFLLVAPALFATALWAVVPWGRRMVWMGGSVGGMIVALALLLSPGLQGVWLQIAQPRIYLDLALGYSVGYRDHVAPWLTAGPASATLQIILIVLSSVGATLLIAPVLAILRLRSARWMPIDVLSLFLLLTYVLLILFAPAAANGDISEYKHRHFVLLYPMVFSITMVWAIDLFRRGDGDTARSLSTSASISGAGALILCLLIAGTPIDAPDIEAIPWAADYQDKAVDGDIVNAALWLGRNADRGDVVAFDTQVVDENYGPATIFTSIAGTPAYVARAGLNRKRSACIAQHVDSRIAALNRLAALPDRASALKYLQTMGARYYVSFRDAPPWDINGDGAVFSSGNVVIYDAQTTPRDLAAWRIC